MILNMLSNQGHILTDDIVINYKNRDRDECLHFLTHLDTSCKDLALFVSPTAKRIYTSIFNAWFLKINFNVKHIDVQGFDTNKSYKITYKGNKYIYSFIDSKFTTGSVALLLHGAFGTYLYTGNFCYYPSFVRSPVLLPVIEEKALTRLYLDNTYYEQPSNFLGFDELATKVAELIKSEPRKNFYIYADKVTMDPLLAEIASKLEEKVYVCQSTMEIMKILGYESYFTRHSNESRIFIDKAFIKKRGFGHDNIAIYFNRYSESCKSFQKTEKKGNVYSYNFYCHSNHKEICELLRILKPESMTFLFSEIDKSKLSYDFKFKYDLPRTVLFNGISTKSTNKVEGETNKLVKNIPRQLIKSTIINDNSASFSKDLNSERIVVSENQNLLNLNISNEGKNLVQRTSENHDVTNLFKEYKCPLRIRKVPEINNTGLSNKLNSEDIDNKCAENISFNNELNYSNSVEVSNIDKNKCNSDVMSHSSSESFHNYHKPKKTSSVEFIKLGNYNSAGNTLISRDIKSLSSCFVKTKTGMPLVFNPKLVKENRLNVTNPKVMHISKVGVVSNGKKKTILLKRRYVDAKKPCLVKVPHNDIHNSKVNTAKKTLTLLKTKTDDKNSNVKQHNAVLHPHSSVLNLSKLFHDWMDNNSKTTQNNSSQISESSINEPEKSISIESENSDGDNIQLGESSINNAIVETRNSLENSADLHQELETIAINQPTETPAGFQLHENNLICNEQNDSTISARENSGMEDKAVDTSPSKFVKLTKDPELDPINKNTEKTKENDSNSQNDTKDTSNISSKRSLSDDENGQSRKKLRSDNLKLCLLQPSLQQREPVLMKECRVLLRQNGFTRTYFYSSLHGCHLPKFWGFKKHEVRPRHILINLRNIQKHLE